MEAAQAAGFVRALPLGLGTKVGQGGTNFSGGQRQRLCIARALLRRVPVHLFDDSFSALDYTTEARVRDALEVALECAVVVGVAERISTVAGAGQILVLDDGRPIAHGTHLQLLETSATYREIASQWTQTGELKAHVEEFVTGHEVIKAFGYQDQAAAVFKASNDSLAGASARAQYSTGIVQPLMVLIAMSMTSGWRW